MRGGRDAGSLAIGRQGIVKESLDLTNFQAHTPDGTIRKLKTLDPDRDGKGAAVLKGYIRRILNDETARFLRL